MPCGIHRLSHHPACIWSKSVTSCPGNPYHVPTEMPVLFCANFSTQDIRYRKWQEKMHKQFNLNVFIEKTSKIIH